MELTTVYFLKDDPTAVIPKKAYESDAGMDLSSVEELELFPGERRLVNTGLKMALYEGWEAQVRPRSGNAYKKGLTVLNAPGTIDASYRNLVKVLLFNSSDTPIKIEVGDRIAQLVISEIPKVRVVEALNEEEFEQLTCYCASGREERGFGSTGV